MRIATSQTAAALTGHFRDYEPPTSQPARSRLVLSLVACKSMLFSHRPDGVHFSLHHSLQISSTMSYMCDNAIVCPGCMTANQCRVARGARRQLWGSLGCSVRRGSSAIPDTTAAEAPGATSTGACTAHHLGKHTAPRGVGQHSHIHYIAYLHHCGHPMAEIEREVGGKEAFCSFLLACIRARLSHRAGIPGGTPSSGTSCHACTHGWVKMGKDGHKLTEVAAARTSQLDRGVGPQSPKRPSRLCNKVLNIITVLLRLSIGPSQQRGSAQQPSQLHITWP